MDTAQTWGCTQAKGYQSDLAGGIALPHNPAMRFMPRSAFDRPPVARSSPLIRGLTLIELMIAVAIVAILAAVAYPSYVDSVRKSRRADAMGSLMQIQTEQEKLRANCAQYAGVLTGTRACGSDTSTTIIGLSSATTLGGYYTLSLSSVSATGYTATATATGSQTNDTTCRTFSITVNGLNVSTAATNSSGTSTGSTCWAQ